jgi:hypothetical protein
MQKMLDKLEKASLNQLHFWIVLLGMLICVQVQYIQHGAISPDSVLYLEAAKLFSMGDWQAGFEIFNWPFYALCIALVNKISQLGVHSSAQLLNIIFFGIASYSFVAIVKLAGGKQKQVIAAALIWLSAQYMIGSVLEMLIRDEGFWAFFLLSIVFFIRFYQESQFKDALLWQLSIIVATLFRIEGILYLLFLPLSLLFQTECNIKQKWGKLLTANVINIGLAMIILLIFAFNDGLSTKILGRLNEVFTINLWQQLTANLNEKSVIMSTQVLGKYLEEFATIGLLLTLLFAIFAKTISTTGFIVVCLSAFGIKNNQRLFNHQSFQVLSAVAIIATISMGLIITKVFVLSGRYVLAFSFILMVFAAFYFAELLFQKTKNNKMHWLALLLVLFMFGGGLKNILPKKQGHNFMQEAVAWVIADNVDNKPVFYDQARMRYYAGVDFIGTFESLSYIQSMIDNNSITHHDYLLIESSKKDNQAKVLIESKLPDYQLIKQFNDAKAKKSVLIYLKQEMR